MLEFMADMVGIFLFVGCLVCIVWMLIKIRR